MIETGNGQSCFLCNGPCEGETVIWFDRNHPIQPEKSIKIWLHPKCAIKLATRLVDDAYDADITVFPPDKVLFWMKARIKEKKVIARVGDKENGRKLTATVLKKRVKNELHLVFKDDVLYEVKNMWP